MSLHMPSGLPARIIQVLKDYLPAELDLIDAEENDTITTPDVGVDDYLEWDRPLLEDFPAISVVVRRIRPLEVHPSGFGSRIHAVYEVDVKAHVGLDSAGDDALRLQKLVYRYATGIVRVLCVQKNGLETAADPVLHDKTVVRFRECNLGPQENQGTGQQTRTALVGIDVDKTESR